MRSKYADVVPGNFEMAVYAQNATDQFTDPALSALNSEDAMERFQLQIMKTSTPEIRTPPDVDRTTSGRRLAHKLITRLFQGGPRGPTEQAYKPELVQSNKSTYTYSVPANDPIIASRTAGGTYHSDVNGNTVFRLALPNNTSNAEIGVRMFNTQNRIAKYAAATQRIENTSQIVDWIPQHKDPMWESRALDEYRKRLMPRIENVDNADNVNREKNRCRDTKSIAYRYRHKEYDTDRSLHEVLDNNNRVMPEVSSRQGDGTSIGELAAELAKRGLASSSTETEIYDSVKRIEGRRATNPNRKGAPHKAVFSEPLPNGDDGDGTRNYIRPDAKVRSETIRIFDGLDNIKKEFLIGEVIDEIKREKKKRVKVCRKDTKNYKSTFDVDQQGPAEGDGSGSTRKSDNKYGGGDRDMLSFNIPLLVDRFKKEITVSKSNPKMVKKSNAKNQSTGDYDYYKSDDVDNTNVDRDLLNFGKKHKSQNIRDLIGEIVPETQLTKNNQPVNPNHKVYRGVSETFAFDGDMVSSDTSLGSDRRPISVGDALKRPVLPAGIVLTEQVEFAGRNKPLNKKRKQQDQVRDDEFY
jgi:hypothetical protein